MCLSSANYRFARNDANERLFQPSRHGCTSYPKCCADLGQLFDNGVLSKITFRTFYLTADQPVRVFIRSDSVNLSGLSATARGSIFFLMKASPFAE